MPRNLAASHGEAAGTCRPAPRAIICCMCMVHVYLDMQEWLVRLRTLMRTVALSRAAACRG